MRRYLLDSNVAGDFIAKRGNVQERARSARDAGSRIGIGVPVLAELYYGIEYSVSREKNLQQLHIALSKIAIWPFDKKAAAEFGRIRTDLRRRGRLIQIIDKMIAAIALTLKDCVVVSADSDFAAIPGLRVESWKE